MYACIIYACTEHSWIVNCWIMYHELVQPKITKKRQLTIQTFVYYLIYSGVRKVFCESKFDLFRNKEICHFFLNNCNVRKK